MKETSCTTAATHPASLYSQFNFSKRFDSWSVTMCESMLRNVTLGFLFNMQGVSSHGPWYNEAISRLELEDYPPSHKMITIRNALIKAQQPALPPLIPSMGGYPDAIIVNRACGMWDAW